MDDKTGSHRSGAGTAPAGNRSQTLASESAGFYSLGHAVSPERAGSMVAAVLVDESDQPVEGGRRAFWFATIPSWLISLLVHVLFIVVLAAISLDPARRVISILEASVGQAPEALQEFELQGPSLDAPPSQSDPMSVPTAAVRPTLSVPKLTTPLQPTVFANLEALQTNSITESIIPTSLLSSSSMAQMSSALNSRSAASKSEMLERFGGSASSEKAVANALGWIAGHQLRNGGWTFTHTLACRNQCNDPGTLNEATNGATAMALLPFLGAGQTHLDGQYKKTVKEGLAFLIKRMEVTNRALPEGSWHEPGGTMYSHGLAAITVCEAYALTRDPDLLQPAQLSLNYLINAQDPRGGGWRYGPGEPGDTSVVGWCLMALKSGKMGSLAVPQSTFQGANRFLDFVSTNKGAYYGYEAPTSNIDGRRATTAVGLLCRMYLGYPKEHPGLAAGVKYLSEVGPNVNDLYYTYYATQVMRHHGGAEWEKWNTQLRDPLIGLQEPDGHAKGSWFTGGPHAEKGGRLYATSLACMILEVYYRHMPLYSERSSADDFEI